MFRTLFLTGSIAGLVTVATRACDICGSPTVQHHIVPDAGTWYAGASEQFTKYKTLRQDGVTIDNDARQKLESSITQIFLGYNITASVGVQVNAPFIQRTFRRVEEGEIQTGEVGGIGDVSVLGTWVPIHHSGDVTFSLKLSAGVKFSTGDSDRVQEEGEEGHSHGGAEPEEEHADGHEHAEEHEHEHEHGDEGEGAEPEEEHAEGEPVESGIHGHDLALGTGSVDGLFGASAYVRWKRLFVAGEVQYALRGDGKHEYDFANDLIWSGGPGIYVVDQPSHTLAVQFICSGETKGEDSFRGQRSNDTAVTNVFLGPRLSGSWRDRFFADIAVDIPVSQENSGVQIVPDYRLRASVTWAF